MASRLYDENAYGKESPGQNTHGPLETLDHVTQEPFPQPHPSPASQRPAQRLTWLPSGLTVVQLNSALTILEVKQVSEPPRVLL